MIGRVVCPLGCSSHVNLIEHIRTSDLARLYTASLKIDISPEFMGIDEIGYYHCPDSDLRFFFPSVEGSAAFYGQLRKFDWYYLQDKPEYEYANRYIRSSDWVLDIGCGEGAFARKIGTQRYVGLETSQAAIAEGVKKGINIINESVQQHCQGNAGRYDVVCAFQVLEHVSDARTFISSAVNCIRPGGLLVLSVPSQDSFARFVSNYYLDMPPHHVTRWTDRALHNIARVFLLTVEEIWHEPLQIHHSRLYAQTIAANTLRSFLRHRFSSVDPSLMNKLITHVAGFLGNLHVRGWTESDSPPRGISVTGIFRRLG